VTVLPGQPGTVAYAEGGDPGLSTLSNYAHPGALVIAGRTNYADQVVKDVSTAGGTVLVYLDAVVFNDWGRYHALLFDASPCGAAVPLWPGVGPVNQWGSLADFRTPTDGGSGLLNTKLRCVLEAIVAENPHVAGFFADDLGSRSWFPNLNWSTWGTANQQAYRNGAITLAQTFHDVAAEHGLAVIVNGTWTAGTLASDGGGYPTLSAHGLSLADGGYIEHHAASEVSYWTSYARGQWGTAAGSASQGHPVMFVVASTDADRAAYNNAGVFAFLTTQPSSAYDYPATVWGPFHPTGLPSKAS
jgi:hypothetical protein